MVRGIFVSDVTLERFFVLRFVLPSVGCVLIVLHPFYLRLKGSSNPAGTDTPPKVPFYPFTLVTDGKGLYARKGKG